mgnify:CR=1 FL=1
MARNRDVKNKYNNVVSGNLAFDYDYQERQERRRAPQEIPAPRSLKKAEPVRREEPARHVRIRERQKVSPFMALSALVLASVVVVVLMSYAQLTTLSNGRHNCFNCPVPKLSFRSSMKPSLYL